MAPGRAPVIMLSREAFIGLKILLYLYSMLPALHLLMLSIIAQTSKIRMWQIHPSIMHLVIFIKLPGNKFILISDVD
jgi:hypothetical protein